MRKSAALYDWVLSHLEQLADSQAASDFYETLQAAERERFLEFADLARGHKSEIEERRSNSRHFDRWGELYDLAGSYADYFPTFEPAANVKLKLVALFGALVAASELDLEDAEIDAGTYEVRPIASEIPHVWFAKESDAPGGSLLYVDTSDMTKVQIAITGSAPPASLIFHTLAALVSQLEPLSGRFALVRRLTPVAGQDDVENFVKLHFAVAGLATHEPHRLSRTPAALNPAAMQLSMGYSQWRDVLVVLSEYNSRDELLLKYMTLYQVVEALMFRLPIVQLESGMDGAMFSIREFRRLYAAVELNELQALRRLFKALFSLKPLGASNFKSIIEGEWQVATEGRASDVNFCLKRLGLTFGINDFQGESSAASFSSLAYGMRNSIVHNKETEFHLTTETLTPGCVLLLEEFLLPALEKMVFAVISSKGNALWYGHRHIRLY